MLVYVAGLAFIEVNGLLRGGDSAMWKVRNIVQVPLLFLVFHLAYRTARDNRSLGRIVVFAALVINYLGQGAFIITHPKATNILFGMVLLCRYIVPTVNITVNMVSAATSIQTEK